MKAALLVLGLAAGMAQAEVIECSAKHQGARLVGASMYEGEQKEAELMGGRKKVRGGWDVRPQGAHHEGGRGHCQGRVQVARLNAFDLVHGAQRAQAEHRQQERAHLLEIECLRHAHHLRLPNGATLPLLI